MITAGLTGQSGAGKTTVSNEFAAAGFKIINADMIARQVMAKGQPCLSETVGHFGGSVLGTDGELDRKKLAEIVFSDRKKLDELDKICYKYINARVKEILNNYRENGIEFVLLDAPTLFEAGEDKLCDTVICVFADESTRAARVEKRDGITREAALKRFSGQHDEEFFRARSDCNIENNGSEEELIKETKRTIRKIMEKYGNAKEKKKEI